MKNYDINGYIKLKKNCVIINESLIQIWCFIIIFFLFINIFFLGGDNNINDFNGEILNILILLIVFVGVIIIVFIVVKFVDCCCQKMLEKNENLELLDD